MNTIKKFQEMLKADESLSTEYKKLLITGDDKVVSDFMKTHGVSDEDINSLNKDKLNDNELDGIAGGVTVTLDWH